MQPHEIERRQPQADRLEIVLSLDPALSWFRGHFAVQPLLPGVAQIDWAMHYATTLLAPGWRFHDIQNVKFQSPLLPGAIVTLTLSWQEARQLITFSYQRHDGEARHTASSGKNSLMPLNFSPCVLIPCYNHGAMMPRVLARLEPFNLPCIVVDDGSDSSTRQELERLAAEIASLTLIRLPQNAGKGAAVIRGLQAAAQAGFSHAVQVDADGQHAIEDIPQLLALAQKHPEALISGQPVYDDSIPRSRLYGRWITHVWVWIETLSLQLKDSMCGFRVYPLAPTLRLAKRVTLGKRMDFDTEVMVRLYWQGNASYFVPTRVTYPPDGVSHFDAFRDNCRISLMHTHLFLGMLPRIPSLLFRRASPHWARQQEVKGLWGMRLMLLVWRLLGRKAFSLLLYPVVGVYWLTASTARRASRNWLARVRDQLAVRQLPVPARLNSYRHFLRFGEAMLDKIASWRGELQFGRDVVLPQAPRRRSVSTIREANCCWPRILAMSKPAARWRSCRAAKPSTPWYSAKTRNVLNKLWRRWRLRPDST